MSPKLIRCKLPQWPGVKRIGRIAAFHEEAAACRQNSFAANFHSGQVSNGWGALQPSMRKRQHVAKTHSLQTVGQLWASLVGQGTVLCALQKSQHVQINNLILLILNTPEIELQV